MRGNAHVRFGGRGRGTLLPERQQGALSPTQQIQALDRTQPSLPMTPGRAGTMTSDAGGWLSRPYANRALFEGRTTSGRFVCPAGVGHWPLTKGGGAVEVTHVDKGVLTSRCKSGPGSCQEAR